MLQQQSPSLLVVPSGRTGYMRPVRFLPLSCTLILALLLAGCGKKEEQAKAPPKPAAPAPAPVPEKPEGPPPPEKGAKAHQAAGLVKHAR